jgi:hypothetical protein
MFGFKRLHHRRARFPRFYYESLQGRLKARIGQDLTKKGQPEVVIDFLVRDDDNWKWKPAGRFRYLDIREVRRLLDETDKFVRGMLTSD